MKIAVLVVAAVIACSAANCLLLHEGPFDFVGELIMLALVAGALIGILALIDYRYRCIPFSRACLLVSLAMAVVLVANFSVSAMLVSLKDDFNNYGGERYQDRFEVVKARNDFLRQRGFIIIGRWWWDEWDGDYNTPGASFTAMYLWCPPLAKAGWYPKPHDDLDPGRGNIY